MSKPRDKGWVDCHKQMPDELCRVDVWFDVHASAMSFGISDSWREPDCWRENGEWFHIYKGKKALLRSSAITHWIPICRRR